MGLDQYIYVIDEQVELDDEYYERLGEPVYDDDGEIDYYDETAIMKEIAYFRKVNCLHGWMDRLCEEKTDHEIGNCHYFIFSKEDLQRLLDDCKQVLAAKSESVARELLPPTEGCFFGSYVIDRCYYEDIQDIIKQLSEYAESDDKQFAYWAWW